MYTILYFQYVTINIYEYNFIETSGNNSVISAKHVKNSHFKLNDLPGYI